MAQVGTKKSTWILRLFYMIRPFSCRNVDHQRKIHVDLRLFAPEEQAKHHILKRVIVNEKWSNYETIEQVND